ncbi:hypothetical protein D4T97_005170 [Siminovitchia acidinfaciens]|uniref:HIRAN domain-containing protein n=1 Tax=Siminovitchia acidinfaciens TaxID=2321395 RepID=A0A429Y429_9BACI|nr:HIRAN domain-containing protein [Siminovitchia acidinfaciens]RST76175.1 hypothetical protein D4T97_005170 [Siminovitchia acidinfaciens]
MLQFFKRLFGEKKTSVQSDEPSEKPKGLEKPTSAKPVQTEQLDEEYPDKQDHNKANIPVIDDPSLRVYNKPFRQSDDAENVVRIIQRPPEGTPKKVAEFVPIAGIKKQERNALRVITSKSFAIRLEKEPNNPYDKNAIRVFGDCEVDEEETSFSLGYIPKDVAKKLAEFNKLKATVRVIYLPTSSKSIGLRLDIWSERAKRKKIEENPYDKNIEVPARAVDKNLKGEELEREGYIENAIQIYEASLRDQPDNNYPYRRLVVIYRRRKEYDKEIKVIEQAISNFEDDNPLLENFKKRLERAKELADKVKEKE